MLYSCNNTDLKLRAGKTQQMRVRYVVLRGEPPLLNLGVE